MFSFKKISRGLVLLLSFLALTQSKDTDSITILKDRLEDTYLAAGEHFERGDFIKGVTTLRFLREDAFEWIIDTWNEFPFDINYLLSDKRNRNFTSELYADLNLDLKNFVNSKDFSDWSLFCSLPDSGELKTYTTTEIIQEIKKRKIMFNFDKHHKEIIESILDGFIELFQEKSDDSGFGYWFMFNDYEHIWAEYMAMYENRITSYSSYHDHFYRIKDLQLLTSNSEELTQKLNEITIEVCKKRINYYTNLMKNEYKDLDWIKSDNIYEIFYETILNFPLQDREQYRLSIMELLDKEHQNKVREVNKLFINSFLTGIEEKIVKPILRSDENTEDLLDDFDDYCVLLGKKTEALEYFEIFPENSITKIVSDRFKDWISVIQNKWQYIEIPDSSKKQKDISTEEDSIFITETEKRWNILGPQLSPRSYKKFEHYLSDKFSIYNMKQQEIPKAFYYFINLYVPATEK